jgi:hypothetical protein
LIEARKHDLTEGWLYDGYAHKHTQTYTHTHTHTHTGVLPAGEKKLRDVADTLAGGNPDDCAEMSGDSEGNVLDLNEAELKAYEEATRQRPLFAGTSQKK